MSLTGGLSGGLSGGVDEGGSGGTSDSHLFQLYVQTDNVGTSADNQFTVPLSGASTYNFDWKTSDGQSGTHTVSTDLTITFPSAGQYVVYIGGVNKTFPRIMFNNGGDKSKLLVIANWGNIEWVTFFGSFFGCDALTQVTTGPVISDSVQNFVNTFRECTSLSSLNMNAFDYMPNLSGIGAIVKDSAMTELIIGNMDLSNATAVNESFMDMPNLASITNATTPAASLTNVAQLCRNSPNLDLDVSLMDWTDVTNANNMMAGSAFSNLNYNKLLLALADHPVLQNGVTLHAGTAQYNLGEPEASRKRLIDAFGWTIIDGGRIDGGVP
ncbi:hypothetical protein CMI37_27565 [Candidatus Pacearchaeota archaeon]|jgi:hypothetical protein|nr:hypothetical protein [Candidatus Pacearchaeota archaeon]|tara:strand:+ start:606 stop:1583 length:978 start_codon:yes stop_codon:yes gene_type:complete